MVFNTDIEDPLERIKEFCSLFSEDTQYFDATIMPLLRPHSATVHSPTHCSATFLLTVPVRLCNRMHNLHGGAAATLFDMATSIAMAPLARGPSEKKPDEAPFWLWAGLTRTLNCTYLRPVPDGMTVAVVCDVLGLGGRLASVRGEIYEWDGGVGGAVGAPLVVCEHGKVNTQPKELVTAKL